MFSESKVTEIYGITDDFCKEFALQQEKYMIEDRKQKHRNKPNRMSDAEIMVIFILFHSGGFRCFKHYYKERALIETVNDELKNIAQTEHSRHRSFNNFIANSLSAIAAYCFFEKKPAIDVNFVNDGQLAIF